MNYFVWFFLQYLISYHLNDIVKDQLPKVDHWWYKSFRDYNWKFNNVISNFLKHKIEDAKETSVLVRTNCGWFLAVLWRASKLKSLSWRFHLILKVLPIKIQVYVSCKRITMQCISPLCCLIQQIEHSLHFVSKQTDFG